MNQPSWRRPVRDLGLAVLLLAVSAAVTETVGVYVDPTWLFLGAVIATTWVGGLGLGLATVAASVVLIDYFVIHPIYSLAVRIEDVPRLIVYAMVAVLVAWLSNSRKKSELASRHARDELEVRVRERTADLDRANQELRWQAGLLDLTHDTIIVRDANDRITYWNRGAEETYGWGRAEAIGKVSHELLQTIFPAPLDQITRELEEHGRWEGELIHTHKNGAAIPAASRWALERDAEGRVSAVLETNNDISDRRRAEESLRKAQADLAHASRVMTMGELTASIAHEINQPLCAVVANGNAAIRFLNAKTPSLPDAQGAIHRIIRDGNRASEVIARIRAMLKKDGPQQAAVDVNQLIRETIKVAQFELSRKRVLVRTELAAGLPTVTGDSVQLQQLLLNLLMNAIEAMDATPTPQRLVMIGSQLDASGSVQVTVRDSGAGLDPADRDRIFGTFYTTKPNGMGMGLSISRSIAQAHGGNLWAAPNDGPGATFHFTIRCDQVSAAGKPEAASASSQ